MPTAVRFELSLLVSKKSPYGTQKALRRDGCCQSKANQSPKHLKLRRSRRQLTPFGQRGGAIFFEGFAAVEMTFEIKMIVDRSMN